MTDELIFDIITEKLTNEYVKYLITQYINENVGYCNEWVDTSTSSKLDSNEIIIEVSNSKHPVIKFDLYFDTTKEEITKWVDLDDLTLETFNMNKSDFLEYFSDRYHHLSTQCKHVNYRLEFPNGGYDHDL